MEGRILTGTASWADPGFVEAWYPPGLSAAYRLQWYAEHFNLVEVNSTFYRMPEAPTVARWCEQTPDGFVFDVKLHRLFSRHSTPLKLLPQALRSKATTQKDRVIVSPELEKAAVKLFLKGIAPFAERGKLGALLLQMTPGFSPRKHALAELDSLIELLAGYRLGIELRNGGWVDAEHFKATKEYFSSRQVAFVMVDGPDDPHFMVLPPVDAVTTPRLAYLRAHGRNAGGYVRGRTVAERFDYQYSTRELKQIADRAVKAAGSAEEVHVIYNNNKADYAPRAAAEFQEIIDERAGRKRRARRARKESSYA